MPAPRYAREKNQRYRLEAARCAACAELSFPPRLVCARCRGTAFEAVRLCGRGAIVTWTVIHVAADAFAMQTPYVVAIVELEEGIRITAQIADVRPEEIAVGSPVQHAFRRVGSEGEGGILQYGYKFVLTSA